MTRDGRGARRKTQKEDCRQIEAAEQRTELLFGADGEVAETRSRSGAAGQIVVVIRDGQAEFSLGEEAAANTGFGEVERELGLGMCDQKAVFELKSSLRNDDARIGDRGRSVEMTACESETT